jgi:hypothetical protein
VCDSPLSDDALAEAAARVRAAWRLVEARAPDDVKERVLETLASYDALVQHQDEGEGRLHLARALEAREDELRGRRSATGGFYDADRLGLVRRMEPVTIRETIDDERVQAHVERYESRARRALERLKWFFKRSGIEVEEPAEPAPWEQPYADFDDPKEHVLDE